MPPRPEPTAHGLQETTSTEHFGRRTPSTDTVRVEYDMIFKKDVWEKMKVFTYYKDVFITEV